MNPAFGRNQKSLTQSHEATENGEIRTTKYEILTLQPQSTPRHAEETQNQEDCEEEQASITMRDGP